MAKKKKKRKNLHIFFWEEKHCMKNRGIMKEKAYFFIKKWEKWTERECKKNTESRLFNGDCHPGQPEIDKKKKNPGDEENLKKRIQGRELKWWEWNFGVAKWGLFIVGRRVLPWEFGVSGSFPEKSNFLTPPLLRLSPAHLPPPFS